MLPGCKTPTGNQSQLEIQDQMFLVFEKSKLSLPVCICEQYEILLVVLHHHISRLSSSLVDTDIGISEVIY